MRAFDVAIQLAALLPLNTDKFTRTVNVTLSKNGSIVTADCETAHGLVPGEAVVIRGARTPITITSLTRSGTVGTAVLATPHDLTPKIATQLEISGANEAEFNGTFTGVVIQNDLTLQFDTVDAGPTVATGSPILENGESALRTYNGSYAVLETPTDAQFTFTLTTGGLPDPVGSIEARVKPRVAAVVTPERMIDVYTEKGIDELWAFVILEDVQASKDRAVESDSTTVLPRNTEYRQQIIQQVTVYVVIPASQSIAGRTSRDMAEDLFRPICQSLLFSAFDSGLHVGEQNPLSFVSHGTFSYDTATYVHGYTFEQVVDLTVDDTVGPDIDVAFKDIALGLFPELGGTGLASLDSTIQLDEPAE